MPELPEVETIAKALREGGRDGSAILGRRIHRAHLLWEGTLETPSPDEFKSRIAGQKIRNVGRRGKYLLLDLSRDTMLIHLRMSGDLLVETKHHSPAPHHRMMLDLEGGLRLSFHDPRKFGRVWLTAEPKAVLGKLGPEPLDANFTAHNLYKLLQARHRQIKPLLLDQNFIAGLGNIYTDEALHLARIHPLTLVDGLDLARVEKLLASIRQVLREGISRNGASIDWVYRGGDFQNHFRVYQRTGEPCHHCQTPIERIVVGQRSTHFCPGCQPLAKSIR
jgi:formamidopyrimidine-DNA glycosylase